MELRGSPEELRIPARALNPATADRLSGVSAKRCRECLSPGQPGLQEM